MFITNPYRGEGLNAAQTKDPDWDTYPWVCETNAEVADLLTLCPKHQQSPLVQTSNFPDMPQGSLLSLKDETNRMGLGSFKALGAAFIIAQEAVAANKTTPWEKRLVGKTYIAASAGNHGLSIAAGTRIFGAQAVIVLAETVPDSFAERLRNFGAEIIIHGVDYAASMNKAVEIADQRGAMLLSDSSWPGYLDSAWKVMQGYSQMACEIVEQLISPPDTIYLQAGVGGLAAACAAVFRRTWGDAPDIIVVEPGAAPALLESIRSGKPVFAQGPVSNMGRLDCKEPSLLALKSLSRDADAFMTISDEQAANTVKLLAKETHIRSTPSGVAGLAGAFAQFSQSGQSQEILCIISEGADE